MGSFVLLVAGDAADASAAELGERTGRQAEWVRRLRTSGTITDGGRIDGASIRVRTRPDRPAVVDVPADVLAEVRSWLLIQVVDLDAAVALARSCPEARFSDVRVLAVDG